MTLYKTSFLSAIATIVRIISGFLITKIIAVYIGPAGLAVIGQLQNFTNIMLIFSGGFLKTAITKYTAEYKDEEIKQYNLWSSAIVIIFILNIFIFIVLFLFANSISLYLLHNNEYNYIFKILSISLPFFVLNTMLMSILNGRRQIKKYILLNILLSLISLSIVVILSILYGLKGTLIAYTTNQSIVFVFTFFFVKNEFWFKLNNFTKGINKEDVRKLINFAMITLTAILSSNISIIYIRDFVVEMFSTKEAGYWQGIWILSQVSLSLITTSLGTYFLPTISSMKSKNDISNELKKAFILMIPIAIVISLSIYLLRETIICLLYTQKFMPMKELFLWQMIGNVIKVCGWLFGYILVAKAMVKYTVSAEITFASTFILLSMFCVNYYGLIGLTYAYAINSSIYLVSMFYIYKVKLPKENYDSKSNNSYPNL